MNTNNDLVITQGDDDDDMMKNRKKEDSLESITAIVKQVTIKSYLSETTISIV